MIFSFFSLKTSLKVAILASIGFFVASCGSYQSSSYYGEDGIYGTSSAPEVAQSNKNNPPSTTKKSDLQNGKYYKDYFSKKAQEYDYINDENVDVFTDVDNYSSVDPTLDTSNQDEVYYNNSYGAWGDNPTKVNINFYSSPRPYYSYWGYSYPWYFNHHYYDSFYDPYYYGGYYGHYGWRWRHHYNPFYRYHYRNHWGYYGHGYTNYHNRSYYPYRSNVSYTRGYRSSVPSRRSASTASVVGQNRSGVSKTNSRVSSRSYNQQTTATNSVSSRAVSSDRRASYRNVKNRSNNVSKSNSSTAQTQRVYQNIRQTNNNASQSSSSNNFRVQNYRRPSSNSSSTTRSSNNNSYQSSKKSYSTPSRSSNSYNSSRSSSNRSYSTPRSSSSSRSSSSRSSSRR